MPIYFQSPPFVWTIVAMAVLAAIFWLRTFLAYRRLPHEAAEDWDYQVSQNMHDLRLTKDAYVRAYKKVHAPRSQLYIASVFTAIFVLTPVAFAFINSILMTLWNSSDEPVQESVRGGGIRENIESLTFEPGNMVWGFFTFFGIIAIWALIAALAARHYYRNAPGLMRDELIEERGAFKPTDELTVGANPAHVKAHSDSRSTYMELFETALGLSKKTIKDFAGSGFICDQYTDGSGMKIYVHVHIEEGEQFPEDTHPFFVKHKHAREDDKEQVFTIISLQEDLLASYEKIENIAVNRNNEVGKTSRRMRGFRHANLEFFIYQK
ncbi:MAG: hypothetical protein EX271_07785 [Acidimicrobiales bacterium]|nr:hypothetical protein [Hyphomonadaceae bacterium]RZV41545.1 MAG: hypothetical protein EX271_07785 [Acidimicrobiales bacterium]